MEQEYHDKRVLRVLRRFSTHGKLKAGDTSMCWNDLVTLNSVETFVIEVSIKAEHLCCAPVLLVLCSQLLPSAHVCVAQGQTFYQKRQFAIVADFHVLADENPLG